jgi:hypothetical protein
MGKSIVALRAVVAAAATVAALACAASPSSDAAPPAAQPSAAPHVTDCVMTMTGPDIEPLQAPVVAVDPIVGDAVQVVLLSGEHSTATAADLDCRPVRPMSFRRGQDLALCADVAGQLVDETTLKVINPDVYGVLKQPFHVLVLAVAPDGTVVLDLPVSGRDYVIHTSAYAATRATSCPRTASSAAVTAGGA